MAKVRTSNSTLPLSWEKFILPAIFAAAFVARLLYINDFSEYPTFYHLNIDQEYYNQWAQRLVKEGFLGTEIYEMTPLYAFFLALVYKFISVDFYIVRLLQIIIGSVTVVLIYKLALKLFENRAVAILSGLGAALYGPFILYDGMVMKSFLGVFFAALTLYLLALFDGKRPIKFLLPGISIGLLILIRENAILLLGAIPLCLLIKDGIGRASIERSVLFILGAVLMILPVTVRNYAVGGEFVPITAGGGEIFYMAFYEESNGYYVPPDFIQNVNPLTEHEEFREEAMKRTGREMTRKESSDYWSAEGFAFFKSEPARMLHLLYRKFIIYWNFYETPDNQNFYFMKTLSPMMKATLSFAIIGPLAILGILVSLRHWRRYLILYAFFLVYMFSVLITFYISRYRIASMPILIIFAASFVHWLYGRLREGSHKKSALATIALIVLLFGVSQRIDDVEPYRSFFPTEFSKLGKSYMIEGDLEGAADAYSNIIKIKPGFYEGHLGLARVLIKQGNYDEAAGYLRNAVEIEPENFRAYLSLAVVYQRQGRAAEAQRMLSRAVSLNPSIWKK